MVKRCKSARDMKRLVKGGRTGRHQTDMLSDHGKRREQGERFERCCGMAAAQGLNGHIEHGQMIGHEERIEATILELLDQPLEMTQIEIGIGIGPRITPRPGMYRGRAHEGVETQLRAGRVSHGNHPGVIG